jgi:NAD(P)-dependent dehydrogenase (short-subunit alcohol dehydrogenase family)
VNEVDDIMASKDNKVALVVGASRGIGRQVAIDLAKNGYTGMYAPYIDSDSF